MMDLPGGNDMQFPELTSAPGDTAYLLFTSGTTGTPKGVPVSNANVCAYLDHVLQTWDFNERDRFSQTFDLTFDLSVHDLMVCWLSGACLCIPEEESPLRMAEYIRQQQISVWFSVPSAAVLMNKMRLLRRDAFPELRLSFFCGEPLPETIADKWLEACGGRELVNLYGPTEATIAISSYTWNEHNKKGRNGIVSIGKIFSKQHCMLLDTENMKPAEKEGELCLAGSQVIRAYLHDPKRTEKQFIRLEGYPGKEWYRTGDRVSIDGEGELFYLGRTDNEVKISGYRVNLLEVDAVLARITGSGQVASVLIEKPGPAIVSFIGAGEGTGQQDIIRACREVLPWYMIPERIIFVDEMPLNVNGKIDRGRLKQMVDE
jgi:amino acid adenylation domain-containing protein